MRNLVGKFVTYNGGTESFSGCSYPSSLVRGKRYLVTDEVVMNFQTNVSLKDVEGEFNSLWFNEVKSNKTEWFALATLYNMPSTFVGKRLLLKRLHEDTDTFEKVTTSTILSVKKIYENIYVFETENSVYVTKVTLRTGC